MELQPTEALIRVIYIKSSPEVLEERHLAVLLDLVQADGVQDGLDEPAVAGQHLVEPKLFRV